jgi:hypothetical protein
MTVSTSGSVMLSRHERLFRKIRFDAGATRLTTSVLRSGPLTAFILLQKIRLSGPEIETRKAGHNELWHLLGCLS